MKINGNLIFADDGKILTDGNNYGLTISLADDRNPYEYTEITIKEYEKIIEEKIKNEELV